jgi:predicted transcriptional regulator
MKTREDVLISLEERHANNIFAGIKRVELRRRTMHVEVGTVIWIYVKQPVGCVVGQVVVEATHQLSPSQIWKRFGPCSGLKKSEFFAYFDGLTQAFVLELKDARKLAEVVTLSMLRDAAGGFHPPQFFSRLAPDGALAKTMSSSMPRVPTGAAVRQAYIDSLQSVVAHSSSSADRKRQSAKV